MHPSGSTSKNGLAQFCCDNLNASKEFGLRGIAFNATDNFSRVSIECGAYLIVSVVFVLSPLGIAFFLFEHHSFSFASLQIRYDLPGLKRYLYNYFYLVVYKNELVFLPFLFQNLFHNII